MDKYQEILDSCDERMNSSLSNFGDNLKKIRTGRANPAMLDGIMVDYYGNMTPLNQTTRPRRGPPGRGAVDHTTILDRQTQTEGLTDRRGDLTSPMSADQRARGRRRS